mgnify:CR=1 FL=1
MPIQFSDYTFIKDLSSETATARGDGSVLVPVSVFGDEPPDTVEVVDALGQKASYVQCGRTFFKSKDGIEVFAGWSYWEDREVPALPGAPCVELFVLSPDFAESAYPRG